jgi:flagellar biosynthesis protein FliQ
VVVVVVVVLAMFVTVKMKPTQHQEVVVYYLPTIIRDFLKNIRKMGPGLSWMFLLLHYYAHKFFNCTKVKYQ